MNIYMYKKKILLKISTTAKKKYKQHLAGMTSSIDSQSDDRELFVK